MKTTAAQKTVLEAVRAGKLTAARTGTVEGNIVARLIRAGLLSAVSTLARAETTYHGRRIPGDVHFTNIVAL